MYGYKTEAYKKRLKDNLANKHAVLIRVIGSNGRRVNDITLTNYVDSTIRRLDDLEIPDDERDTYLDSVYLLASHICDRLIEKIATLGSASPIKLYQGIRHEISNIFDAKTKYIESEISALEVALKIKMRQYDDAKQDMSEFIKHGRTVSGIRLRMQRLNSEISVIKMDLHKKRFILGLHSINVNDMERESGILAIRGIVRTMFDKERCMLQYNFNQEQYENVLKIMLNKFPAIEALEQMQQHNRLSLIMPVILHTAFQVYAETEIPFN